MSTVCLPLMMKEELGGPPNHLESTPRNVIATIRGVNSEGVIVGTLQCTRRLSSTNMDGRKKRATIKTDVAAAACGAGDENAS